MMRVYVNGVGLCGPGLPNWQESRAVLLGKVPHQGDRMPDLTGAFLPAIERRRAGRNTKLAAEVAQEAISQSELSPQDVATIFASSSGDTEVIHHICETLAGADRMVSPMRFHNSVHNAAAGYWAIAANSHQSSTSIACYDHSVAAGLLEAATQSVVEQMPVLLVVYETPYPEPLARVQATCAPFGASLLLTPAQNPNSIAQLAMDLMPGPAPGPTFTESLERLRRGNFAARILPLLRAIASKEPAQLTLDHASPLGLHVECTPCR